MMVDKRYCGVLMQRMRLLLHFCLILLASRSLRSVDCLVTVRFEYPEEYKDKHVSKRALLIPHMLPYGNSDGETVYNMKDELMLLGSAAAIIRSNLFNELTILERYTNISNPTENFHLGVLSNYAKSLEEGRNITVRIAEIDSNHTWQYWKDAPFQKFAAHYDNVYFIGADAMDGQHSCSNTHHRLRLIYVAAKSAPTVVMGVTFHRKSIDRCPTTLRFLRALLESNPCTWAVQDTVSMRDITSIPAAGKTTATALRLSIDPSFLAPPGTGMLTKQIEDVLNRLEIDKLVARGIIGVNLLLSKKVKSDQLLSGISAAICHLHNLEKENGISVVYVPHDYSPEQSDVHTAALFAAAVRKNCPGMKQHIHTFGSAMLNVMEVKEVMARLDLLVTTRFYAGVNALSAGIPTALVAAPPGRCSYLSKLLTLSDLCFSAEDAANAASMKDYLASRWKHVALHKTTITGVWPRVETLAMENVVENFNDKEDTHHS